LFPKPEKELAMDGEDQQEVLSQPLLADTQGMIEHTV